MLLINRKTDLRRLEKENSIRKRVLISKEEKSTRESIITSQAPKAKAFEEKLPILPQDL